MMGSTFGSSLASLFFLWATIQQIFPNHLKIAIQEFLLSTIQQLTFFQRFFDRFIYFFSPYVEINFSQYEDYQFNHAFSAIETYLGAKATDKAKHLRASQVKDTKGLVLKRDETKVRDEYVGVGVWWENGTDSIGFRTYKLTFHRRSRDVVTESYINYVVEEGKLIEAKNKKPKLFTNNPSFQWGSSKTRFWRYIDFEQGRLLVLYMRNASEEEWICILSCVTVRTRRSKFFPRTIWSLILIHCSKRSSRCWKKRRSHQLMSLRIWWRRIVK